MLIFAKVSASSDKPRDKYLQYVMAFLSVPGGSALDLYRLGIFLTDKKGAIAP